MSRILKFIAAGGLVATIVLLVSLSVSSNQSEFLGEGVKFQLINKNFKSEKAEVTPPDGNANDTTPETIKKPVSPPEDNNITNSTGWLQTEINRGYQDIIPAFSQRLEAHIYTDKVIYRPNDVMFIEVYVVDGFNKTPVSLNATDVNFQQLWINLEIRDPLGASIHSDNVQTQNSTAVFAFKVPDDASGGEYTIKADNYELPAAVRLVRIREYARDQLVITTQFNKDSYQPGETISGRISVQNADGSPFAEGTLLTYSYQVDFQSSTSEAIQINDVPLSSEGIGLFNIQIPNDTQVSLATISFTVNYGSISQTHSATVTISQPDQTTIDFYQENGFLVPNVPNKIYFQAWATDARADSYDFQNASLIVVRKSDTPTFAPVEVTLLDQNLSTVHKGKGFFNYTPTSEDEELYIRIDSSTSRILRKEVNMTLSKNELSFSVINENRVLENGEDLQIVIYPNERFIEDDLYLIEVKQKERTVYSRVHAFDPGMENILSIPAEYFPNINGGIFEVTVRRLTPIFYEQYRQEQAGESSNQQDQNITINPQVIQEIAEKIKEILPPIETPQPDIVDVGDVMTPDMQIIPEQPQYSSERIIGWFNNLGEISFFKKPSKTLSLVMKTDKETYAPGDEVNYEIQCLDRSTNRPVDGCYVSITVTDDSVFQQLEERKQPPSFAARVYLENEIERTDSFEFYWANQYIEHWWQANAPQSNDLNLELLLGVQGWRFRIFELDRLREIYYQELDTLSEETKDAIQALYAYVLRDERFRFRFFKFGGGVEEANGNGQNSEEGTVFEATQEPQTEKQTHETRPADFMGNISNPRFWAHERRANWTSAERIDLTETVLFNSANRTGVDGTLRGSFFLSDLITKFRIIANAFDSEGVIGYEESSFQTQKPLYINFDIPVSLTLGDEMEITAVIVNLNDEEVSVSLFIVDQDAAIDLALSQSQFIIPAGESVNVTIPLTARNLSELAYVTLAIEANTSQGLQQDLLRLQTRVIPKGFPREVNYGGFIGSQVFSNSTSSSATFNVTIPETVESGSSIFDLKIFSSNFAQLVQAVQSLIREPYGCFEQLSATTYPLVMALDFVKSMPEASSDPVLKNLTNTIEDILRRAYPELVKYKTQENGYEWFGDSPAHEALSAYGLMQFTEMQQVTDFVDAKMVEDLQQWILTRRSNGTFLQNPKALDSFGSAPLNITNAYIVWSLSSSGITDLDAEINTLKQQADEAIASGNGDAYFFSLLAASLYNLNRTSEAQEYADVIIQYQLPDGNISRSLTTITNSDGSQRIIETTAMAVIAWLNDQERYSEGIIKAVDWLVKQVEGGQYGGTQGTILTLKALTTYMQNFASLNGDGEFVLRLNGEVAQTISFTADRKEVIEFNWTSIWADPQFSSLLTPGSEIEVSVALENFELAEGETKDFKVNYAFSYNYYDTTPIAPSSVIGFQVFQDFPEANLGAPDQFGNVFGYNITVTNLNQKGEGMTVVILRVPACLEVNFDLLEQLKRNKLIDQYEVNSVTQEIVIYWRDMAPGETKNIQMDLIQRYQGMCQQKPHTAYFYYNNDEPAWVLPQPVQ